MGKVFEITGEEYVNKTFEKLDAREYSYTRDEATVFFKDSPSANNETSVCGAVVYFANTKQKNFVEQETLTETTEVIAGSRGMRGHNVEYLFRVIDFMQENQSDSSEDEYLFELNDLVRSRVGISASLTTWQQISMDEDFKIFL